MCCLIACKTQRLNLETVHKVWETNDDGAGVAWFENKRAKYIKGLKSPQEVFDLIQKLPLPHIVHFRLHSNGGYSPLLTHPFEVSRESKLRLKGEAHRLLFHNGHDGDYNKYLSAANLRVKDNSPMNDTRALAMVISNNNERFLRIASGKFILADATCEQFKTFGDFYEAYDIPGIIFSNTIWKYKTKTVTNNTNTHYQGCSTQGCGTQTEYYRKLKAQEEEIEQEALAEIEKMQNEGSPTEKSPALQYKNLTLKEKEQFWTLRNKKMEQATADYWLHFPLTESQKEKMADAMQRKLRLTNGAAAE